MDPPSALPCRFVPSKLTPQRVEDHTFPAYPARSPSPLTGPGRAAVAWGPRKGRYLLLDPSCALPVLVASSVGSGAAEVWSPGVRSP